MLNQAVATHGLASFRTADPEDMAAGRGVPEIVIETEDAVHFSLGEIQLRSNKWNGTRIDIPEIRLERVEYGQQGAREMFEFSNSS